MASNEDVKCAIDYITPLFNKKISYMYTIIIITCIKLNMDTKLIILHTFTRYIYIIIFTMAVFYCYDDNVHL